MGSVEIEEQQLIIYSHIITYGNAATAELTEMMRDEIETMWNEPQGSLRLESLMFKVVFKITGEYKAEIADLDIYQNLDPRNNYFRIEEYASGNISFVDGIGCNSGYFKLENLYKGSTTVAHEYGHTIGLDHPHDLDLRGKGVPGIMYPRGTLVDPQYQYDPGIPAGEKGGTLHPMNRKVLQHDIDKLKLYRLQFENSKAILGEFTNYWHPDHAVSNQPE
ncbi:MAG: peptidase M10 [Sphingobacteriales bacterium]|nr:peptidase M10 [Sphingobacteriales bacterium]